MSGYCIFRRPGDPEEGVVFAREGFSAPAAVFTVFWALWHRMWVVATVMAALLVGLATASGLGGISQTLAMVIQAAAALLFGLEGHRLREWSLRRSGYAEVGFVIASSREEAELKYFLAKRQPETPQLATAYRPMAHSQSDPLGLFGNV